MWILVWAIFTVTSQGLASGNIPENTKFKSEAECKEFGERMTPRIADWTRGMIQADWNHEVMVQFKCEPDGRDA